MGKKEKWSKECLWGRKKYEGRNDYGKERKNKGKKIQGKERK